MNTMLEVFTIPRFEHRKLFIHYDYYDTYHLLIHSWQARTDNKNDCIFKKDFDKYLLFSLAPPIKQNEIMRYFC